MIRVSSKLYSYRAFGLTITSELYFPELIQQNNLFTDEYDVHIFQSDLENVWFQISNGKDENLFADKGNIFIRIPNTALFAIKEGKEIIYHPLEDADEDKIRLYILGSCMGAILLQKRIFTLHGSCVEINGKAYAFVGKSGAGKSTLASVFMKKGFNLLSDDVIAISVENSIPTVSSSYGQQKLWEESIDQLGMDTNQYRPLFEREKKFAIPVTNFSHKQLPLAAVIEITKGKISSELSFEPIMDMERFSLLFRNTYRNIYLMHLNILEWHFNTSAEILTDLDVYKCIRPNDKFTIYEIYQQIIKILED